MLKTFGAEGWEWHRDLQEWGAGGGEPRVLPTHRKLPRRVVTTALHVLGEDGGPRPGGTTDVGAVPTHRSWGGENTRQRRRSLFPIK